MGRELQAMQRDDASNPGVLWVQEGLQSWARPEGPRQVACASCHGASPQSSMRGAAARHPAWDAATQRPVTLAGRIAHCRNRHQGMDSRGAGAAGAVLALETAVAHASRGLPMTPAADPGMAPWRERGAALWQQRVGQLNLSCAQCHDQRAGLRLGGALIPPGNASGYPTYRLEWQAVGPLTRRLRNCMTGVRAEPHAPESDESLALQVYMAWRDRGPTACHSSR
ncbi:MAG: sulfur oxidation c-type cytochrome SoxA [Rubrivivax sp.]